MGVDTKIEWAHHTFNPWIGCTKVGPGCDHCYAEALMDGRHGKARWGAGQPRVRTAESTWKQPLSWNRKAAAAGIRQRVFCSSLADVFDNEVDPQWRDDLWRLILDTPQLDWLLLTKRIGNVLGRTPIMGLPGNVWLGATIVNQAEADRDIPKLLEIKTRLGARKVFLSMEPLLGPVDIRAFVYGCYECGASCGLRLPGPPKVERCFECGEECGPDTEPVISEGCPKCGGELEFICPDCSHYMVYQHPDTPVLDWIIVGGESGPGARPMHPDWTRSLRDQCAEAGVPFLFKQWGEMRPYHDDRADCAWMDPNGSFYGGPTSWPPGPNEPRVAMVRVGKKAAGRLLDGVQHDGLPA